MAVETLSQLPRAVGLAGNELVLLSQQGGPVVPWVSKTATVQEIAAFSSATGKTTPSMRQLVAALASQGVLISVIDAIPGDVTNSINIAWEHAYQMSIADVFVTGFLQPTLGYSGAQLTALFVLALTFPA